MSSKNHFSFRFTTNYFSNSSSKRISFSE